MRIELALMICSDGRIWLAVFIVLDIPDEEPAWRQMGDN